MDKLKQKRALRYVLYLDLAITVLITYVNPMHFRVSSESITGALWALLSVIFMLTLLTVINSKMPTSETQVFLNVLFFGIAIVGVSYGLAVMFYNTMNPNADQISIFVNAMLGSAVSMVAIRDINRRDKNR